MLKKHVVIILILVLLPLLVTSRKSNSGSRHGVTKRPTSRTTHRSIRPAPTTTRRRTTYPITTTPRQTRTTKRRTPYPMTTTPRATVPTRRRTSHPITTTPVPFRSTTTTRRSTLPTKGYEFDRLKAKNSSTLGSGIAPKKNSTSNFQPPGWQVPSQPPPGSFTKPTTRWTTPRPRNASNIGWTSPTTPQVGWVIPKQKNSTLLGNNPNILNTTPRTNSSNIGWVTPTKPNIGWVTPKQNNSTFLGTPPNVRSTTPSWIYSTTPSRNASKIGWTTPRPKNSTFLGTPPNVRSTTPSWIYSTTPSRNASKIGWTTPRPKNSTLLGKAPNTVITTPRPNINGMIPKKNVSISQRFPDSISHGSTPRPFEPSPTVGPLYQVQSAPQYQYQPSYRPNDVYWNQNHYTHPQQSPIINNYHTTNYGYAPTPPVTIINTNINNVHYPRYSYSRNDYGDSDLGFYIGFKLGQMSRPSYHYYTSSYYNGREHVSLYDHYEIHHHYHNSVNIKKEATVVPNQIIQCPGDSYAFCLPNTTALCLNTGSVMCVLKTELTRPCDIDRSLNCLTSSLPCVDSSAMNCYEQTKKPISVPCISTLNLQGTLANNNNSLTVVSNSPDVNSLCVTVVASPAETNKTKTKWENYRNRKTYHYATRDTGTSALGFFVGQSLEELLDPGYKYMNYHQNGSYLEKYDHYYVYHHFINSDLIPKTLDIYANTTIACFGDSGTFCPEKTTSLCVSDGSVFCLVNATDRKGCFASQDGCVESQISCNNSKIPDCRNATNVTITVPCFSSVYLHGNVSIVNSTFVSNNVTKNYGIIQVLPNVTDTHLYCLTVLAVPAEKILENKIEKTAKRLKTSYARLPKYTYDRKMFDNNSLGYYLADKLENLQLPSIYYLNLEISNQTGVVQKYDHYDIYYYYLNKNNFMPKEIEIASNNILPCAGDSAVICPRNTTALCLNTGTILCVTDALQTGKCNNATSTQKHCIRMSLSCFTMNAPKCSSPRSSRNVVLPCMSWATVYGNVVSVNNRLLASGIGDRGTTTQSFHYSDIEPVDYENMNRTQQFCVTIAVMPAERPITEGEIWYDKIKQTFSKFVVSAFTN